MYLHGVVEKFKKHARENVGKIRDNIRDRPMQKSGNEKGQAYAKIFNVPYKKKLVYFSD